MTGGKHMENQWTKEEMERVEAVYMRARPRGFPIRGVLNELATEAVSLFLARASGLVAEDEALLLPCCRSMSERTRLTRLAALAQEAEVLRASADELQRQRDARGEALGAAEETIEVLRATVAERDNALDESLRREDAVSAARPVMNELLGLMTVDDQGHPEDHLGTLRRIVRDLKDARTEVERLKVSADELHRQREHYREALEAAESRLAAIRERATSEEGLRAVIRRDFDRSVEAGEGRQTYQSAGCAVARWVLEGDAPSLSTTSSSSAGDAPQEKSAAVELVEMVLSCTACRKTTPHTWMRRGHEATPRWRCDACGLTSSAGRYPCSPACTHDDAATPGHPERVRAQSEVVRQALGMKPHDPGNGAHRGTVEHDCNCASHKRRPDIYPHLPKCPSVMYEAGAEAMRAACWEAAQLTLMTFGIPLDSPCGEAMKAAVEGAVP
jgi:hypothetical protein